MRRYRTRTTAWPAVADLMTALAVVGLACALLVAANREDPDSALPEVLQARIDSLEIAVDSLRDALAEEKIGVLPCWRGNDPGDYYRTFDVTVRDGRFSVAVHEHWAPGTELRGKIPPSLVSVLEDFPQGKVAGEQLTSFGERVDRAVQEAGYAADCRIVVTINTAANGNEIGMLTRAGFYPVWR